MSDRDPDPHEQVDESDLHRARERAALAKVEDLRRVLVSGPDPAVEKPGLPACPRCGSTSEVERVGDRFMCERCDVLFAQHEELM